MNPVKSNSDGDGNNTNGELIPYQLKHYPLIQVSKEAKAPVKGPDKYDDLQRIEAWVEAGGNYGVSATESNDLVILDIDSSEFQKAVSEVLPETFTVETGSGGYHRYYRCDSFDANRKFSDPEGSIRSSGWYAVGPSSIHPNGSEYQVIDDRKLTEVSESELLELIEKLSNRDWYRQHRGGGRGAAGVGGDTDRRGADESIPEEYPNREASWHTLRKWLKSNGYLDDLDRTACSDWSALEFKLAKCLAEGGFSESSIFDALDRLHPSAKWHNGSDSLSASEYQALTVQKAIEAALDDPYVDFDDTPDDAGTWSDPAEGPDQEKIMAEPDYTEKEAVHLLEASEEGESFKKLTLTERREDGESVEYLSIKEGYVNETQTVDGQTVLAQNITNNRSLGFAPENIDQLIDGLEEMKEKLE